ncbi:AAA family ATPase [Streptomyces sp. NPDC001852]|uniref:AAA family ATPase n=1 Tax=Streptomyces sp. NPDC001852 TaxID=3364619 RepID=UPI00367F5710
MGGEKAKVPGGGDLHHKVLSVAVEAVLARLDAHASGRESGGTAPSELPACPEPEPGSALDTLCSCFGLSPFERDVLVLAAAAELDSTTASRCAAAGGDPARPYPTFSLALAALDDAHWSALAPVGPLRRWRLLELDDRDGSAALTASRIRIDERILHFLVGVDYLDVRLHGLLNRIATSAQALPPAHERTARDVSASWAAAELDVLPHVELAGADRQTRWEIAAAAARESGLALYAVSAEDLPTDPGERDQLARLWQREAVLLPAALLVESHDGASVSLGEAPSGLSARDSSAAVDALTGGLAVPLVLSADDPRPATACARAERVTVPALSAEEQLDVWTGALGDLPDVTESGLRGLVAQFSLPAHVIRAAATSVRRSSGAADARSDSTQLAWRAGLVEARMALDELGRRVEPRAGWDDLVVAERQRAILREIVAHVRRRATVHQEWGFESVLRRGLGVTALFAGGSGTGKTLAAEVMAGELGVDLFVIDLSQVVSKYIGETEKNLRRVFDAAERGGALLLFDEADSLFGKRSEVKDSHDRYANLEVSYLLMRMEAYRGLAVLTTNMKKALDNAFMRRIRFVVDFPFPSVPERAEIWRRVIPDRTPTEGLDPERLAQLTVAGGSIRNIALAGAFLAAEEGSPVRMRHMLAAARTEYLKLERSLTPSEVDGWV